MNETLTPNSEPWSWGRRWWGGSEGDNPEPGGGTLQRSSLALARARYNSSKHIAEMFASRCRFRLQVAKPDSAPIYRSCVWLCSWEALITMLTGRLPAEPFPQGIRFWNQKVRIGDHIQGSPQPISSPCKRSVLQVDANWTGSPLCSKALKNNGDKASGNSAVPLRQQIQTKQPRCPPGWEKKSINWVKMKCRLSAQLNLQISGPLCGQRQRKGLLRVFFCLFLFFWGGRGRVVGVSIFLVNSPGEGSAGNRKVRGGRWRRQGRRRDGDLLKETAQDPAIWAFKKRA